MSKIDNLTYSFRTDGWIYIYEDGKEIAHVETYSKNKSLYSYLGEIFFEWSHKLCLNGNTFYMNPDEQAIVKISSDVNEGYNGHLYGWNTDIVTIFWDGDVRNSYDNEVIKEVKKVIELLNKQGEKNKQ